MISLSTFYLTYYYVVDSRYLYICKGLDLDTANYRKAFGASTYVASAWRIGLMSKKGYCATYCQVVQKVCTNPSLN